MFNLVVERLDRVFQALADPTRRAMVRRLSGGECTVTELAAPFPISLAASSKHVRVLERAGLVRRSVQGRRHVCRLDPGPLAEVSGWLEYYQGFWASRLDDLERLVAERRTEEKGQS
jgi:DNA-binding transcriptional ArsR family regulator